MRSAVVCAALSTLLASSALLAGPPADAQVQHAAGRTTSRANPADPVGVVNLGHRGVGRGAPEHTMAALDQAVADHADRLSIDVHLTKDGVPILLHDDSLARTTDVERRFPSATSYAARDFTLAQIKTLDAGSWFDPVFTGSRVLTLDEALTELDDSPVGIVIEAKQPWENGGAAGIGRAIMDVVARHPAFRPRPGDTAPRLLVESFSTGSGDWPFLDAMHRAYPDLALVLLAQQVTATDIAQHPYVREVDVGWNHLSPALLTAAHQRGVRVGVWTVDDRATMERLLTSGVDGVTSDDPDLLRRVLAAGGRTWTGTSWPATPVVSGTTVSTSAAAVLGSRLVVTVRAVDAAGAPARWTPVVVQTRTRVSWAAAVSTATGAAGTATVSLAATDGLRLRATVRGRVSATVAPEVLGGRVILPGGAPGPSYRLAAQPVSGGTRADPRVLRLPASVGRAMVGRSFRRGCPVGRVRLRLLRVGYWGFDGRTHRGGLVVAAHTATRLGRVFEALYAARLPVRSLQRVESVGGWGNAVARSLRADATFGYACQRLPGDRRTGSHARGTVITMNPWENPSLVGGSADPNRWWVSRARPMTYVHTSTGAVVDAFEQQGFAWNGDRGRYAEFRDLR